MFAFQAIRIDWVGSALALVFLLVSAAAPAGALADATAGVSPGSAGFPDTAIGQTTPSQQFTLKNDGPDAITVGAVALAGSDPSDFSIVSDGCANATLQAGESCPVDVAFAPAHRGQLSAQLEISHSGDNSPALAGLTGKGALRQISVSPPQLSFPATTVGYPGGQQQVTVKNDGDLVVSINNVMIDGNDPSDFGSNGNCGGGLSPGQSCNVNVSFWPGSAGDKSATLRVQSDDPRGDQTVDLQGTAAAPQLAFEPADYDFGLQLVNVGGFQTMFQLRNTGAAPVQVNNLDIGGPGSGAFWTGFSNCYGAALQPNDTCSVQVSFGPSDTVSYAAQLQAHVNGATFTADLSGRGGRPVVTASPSPTDFGSAAVGGEELTRAITFTNTGDLPAGFFVAIVSGGDVGSFQLLDENCTTAPLDPAASCTAHVRFRPTGPGPRTALLSLIGNQGDNGGVVLTGVGENPHASLTPGSHDFGEQTVNSAGPPKAFALHNGGGTPLRVGAASIAGADADQFRLSRDECSDLILAPGEGCEVRVRFAPDAGGAKSARLRIAADGAPLTASLSGAALGTPRPRVSFRSRGGGVLRRGHATVVAGRASCHGASFCKLRARARIVARLRDATGTRSVAIGLPAVRMTIAPGKARKVRLRLRGAAARLRAADGGRLLLELRWSAAGYLGYSRSSLLLG